MNSIVYLNLTNGIEFINDYTNARFLRIQSSHCESRAYNELVKQLDSDFLFNLAIGNKCIVVDASNGFRIAKSLRTGLNVIYYLLQRAWFDKIVKLKGFDDMFLNRVYCSLDKNCKNKLHYFQKFCLEDSINLCFYNYKTTKDGDYDFYRGKVLNNCRTFGNAAQLFEDNLISDLKNIKETRVLNAERFYIYIAKKELKQMSHNKEITYNAAT